MGMLVRTVVLMSPLLFCNALLDLAGPNEIEGVWKGSTILPCSYMPVKDFVQQTLTWTVVHDQNSGTIFRRDSSGDHILLSEYRDRVSVLKNSPGNVSLHILRLEISDRGTYTCQVTWRASNNSLITREITTRVEVVKVAVTKPIIRAGELGLMLPAGARTSLTCVASGSPPISYRWFLGEPGGKAQYLSSQAELTFDSLRPSDSGKYYCEAENRVGARVARQSDAVELTVRDLPTTTVVFASDVGTPERYHTTTEKSQTELVFRGTSVIPGTPQSSTTVADLPLTVMTSENDVGNPGKNHTTKDFQKTHLSLYLIILIAVVCSAVVFLIIFIILCIRKPKNAHVYEVKFHNNSMRTKASSRFDSVGHYEESISSTENNYMTALMKNNRSEETNLKENEYDTLKNTKESEYEVGDTV
ncbi:V-set and immunoglobulin domain-containing protein 4-like isoform X1 [Apteryx rowi]|uniref:V-set and immunoglobulin domain-containing protein 4-like isoform X1 n=1 Tax=Apteryx rowi TaxID=308060 RepID=UPI0006B090AB|nr:PREDICTED: V-set and immunoglobulin domain-containing protein 4-like [Apteryx mantelli mantelli]XP_025921901.1 V-set and immunoglobulin domain-containing protein 4-like isoform X1 [Apteryx rowi]